MSNYNEIDIFRCAQTIMSAHTSLKARNKTVLTLLALGDVLNPKQEPRLSTRLIKQLEGSQELKGFGRSAVWSQSK